jgi:hypothetical protein
LNGTTPVPKRSVSDELLFGEDVAENPGGVIKARAVAVQDGVERDDER